MASIDTLYGGIDLPMVKLAAGMYVVGIVEVEKKEVDNVGDKMRAGPHTPRPQPVPLRSPLCGLPTSFSGGIFSDSAILSHKHFVESGDLQRHRLAKECLWMMTVGSSLAVLPFNVILGSSLQGLFDGTPQLDAMLWRVLDMLLSKKNPNAL
eukprot:scaffold5469_cov175-Alexandrium_tamarense.AAC.1